MSPADPEVLAVGPRPDAAEAAGASSAAGAAGAAGAADRTAVVDPGAGRPGSLLASELLTLFRRRRTIALLAVLAAVPILIAVAVRVSGHGGSGDGPPFLDQVTRNGLFVAVTALTVTTPFFLPLTVGVVAGDTIAGEASLGTLRYLLVAPVGRTRLLLVKIVGAAAFCLAATLTLAVVGMAIGAALFPVGRATLLSGTTVSAADAAGRALLVAAYLAVSMIGLSAVGLFVSTLTDVPVGAMAATVILAIAAQILDTIPQVAWLHPWLFSHDWLAFADLLRDPMVLTHVGHGLALQAGYLAVFGSLAWARFTSKDVLA